MMRLLTDGTIINIGQLFIHFKNFAINRFNSEPF